MPISAFGRDAAFDSETTALLGAAFEAAWDRAKADRRFADEAHAAAIRDLLARHIIELGRRGERDHDRLVQGALDYLANTSPPLETARAKPVLRA
jgi:hypothetical protein